MDLKSLEALLARLDAQARDRVAEHIGPEAGLPWRPQPGPQTLAYTSRADLLLYGGAAGGGKSDLLIGLALNNHLSSAIFRQRMKDVTALQDRIGELVGEAGLSRSAHFWRRGGQKIEFGHLEKPGSEKAWQGRPHDFLGFDEGAQIPGAKVMYVMAWLRSVIKDQRCRAVIASNPPLGSDGDYLLEWFGPWLDPMHPRYGVEPGELLYAVFIGGEGDTKSLWLDGPDPVEIDGVVRLPRSRTFIPSLLSDNAYLRETPYGAQIDALPEPMRTALKTGDFLAARRDHRFQVVPTKWVQAAQNRWRTGLDTDEPMRHMGIDVAQGGEDQTVIACLRGRRFDELTVAPGTATPNGPAVAALALAARRDGAAITIDLTGGWGGSVRDHLRTHHNIAAIGFVASATGGARTADGALGFLNRRAEAWWRLREALDPETGDDLALPLDRLLAAELTAPQWRLRGQWIVVESKDDVRRRLGRSTDRADAVLMAWLNRDKKMPLLSRDANSIKRALEIEDPFENL